MQAAQTSDVAGDLSEDTAEADSTDADTTVERIIIDAENCRVADDATITFREPGTTRVGVVENGDNVEIDPRDSRIVISDTDTTGDGDNDIEFFGDQLAPEHSIS